MNAHKLVYGMEQVWEAATHRNSRLLLVEKDFTTAARQAPSRCDLQRGTAERLPVLY